VLYAWRGPDDVAGPDDGHLTPAGLDEADAVGDDELLPSGVGCQAVRAQGVNRTRFIRTAEGSGLRTTTSM
jgi:hypothetical protein